MEIDRSLLDLGTVLVVTFAIGIGQWALTGHGRPWVRVAIGTTTTIVTYGAAYLALVPLLRTPDSAGPWLACSFTPFLAAVVLVGEAVVWVLLMIASARRRAERQGRFHPEHRLPFQRPF